MISQSRASASSAMLSRHARTWSRQFQLTTTIERSRRSGGIRYPQAEIEPLKTEVRVVIRLRRANQLAPSFADVLLVTRRVHLSAARRFEMEQQRVRRVDDRVPLGAYTETQIDVVERDLDALVEPTHLVKDRFAHHHAC